MQPGNFSGTDNGEFIICGLVGCAGHIGVKEDNALKLLLILDGIRGIDSTGAAFISSGNRTTVVKQVGNPYELAADQRYEREFKFLNRAIIGHNRWATQGAVNKRNAHPFDFDTLVGVHNGSLTSKWRLDDAKDFTVDSENLFHHIEKKGLKDALNNLAGAWSLVWWDKLSETLNFLRNKERPLMYCKSEDGKTLFWASEAWMLEVALSRYDIKRKAIESTVEDMHYEMHIDDKGVIAASSTTYAPATYYVPPVVQHTSRKWGPNNTSVVVLPPLNLVEEKKSTVSAEKPTPINNGVKRNYINSKGQAYELVSLSRDGNGAEYIHCFDPLEPHLNIRLYIKPDDAIRTRIGDIVQLDVKDIKVHKDEGTYYKLGRDSLKEIDALIAADVQDLINEITGKKEDAVDAIITRDMQQENEPFEQNAAYILPWDQDDEPLFKNHRGTMISRRLFYVGYGNCQICSDLVEPDKPHKFTLSGDAVCGECVADKEVSQYVNFA